MSAMDFCKSDLGASNWRCLFLRFTRLCNYLQNVVATTYILGLQLPTFIFYNKHHVQILSSSLPGIISSVFLFISNSKQDVWTFRSYLNTLIAFRFLLQKINTYSLSNGSSFNCIPTKAERLSVCLRKSVLKAGAEHTTLLPSDYSFDIWRFADAKDSSFPYPYKTSLK